MKVIYPALFTVEDDSYNVEFPDLEGCITYGDSLEEAICNAKEALSGYCGSILERGLNLPKASPINNIHPETGFVSYIDAEPLFSNLSVKKTLTIPAWLNKRSEEVNAPYSKILQDGLMHYLKIV